MTLLMRAGCVERASDVSVRRTAKAVGALTALASASGSSALAAEVAGGAVAGTAASSLASASSVVTTLAIVKWLMLGAGGGVVLTLGAHHALSPQPSRASAPNTPPHAIAPTLARSPSALPGDAVKAPLIPAETNGAETAKNATAQVERATSRAAPIEATPRGVSASGLAIEVAFIDHARTALSRGNASGTLLALQDYEARFPERQLHTEVLALRMEAAHRLGDTQTVRKLATRLLAIGVARPLSERARELGGE
jgi:hypothetical protein